MATDWAARAGWLLGVGVVILVVRGLRVWWWVRTQKAQAAQEPQPPRAPGPASSRRR